jgi:hypothetical protein
MKDKTNILVAGIVALVVALFTVWVVPAKVTNVDNTKTTNVGALAGPDIASKYVSWGGVRNWAQGANLNGDAASTTICVIQAPQVASSTLKYFGIRESTSSTTASTIAVYKSKSQWLATTLIAQGAAAANQNDVTLVATSTVLDTTTATFAPSDWIVVRQTGGTGTMSPVGSCGAQFVQI